MKDKPGRYRFLHAVGILLLFMAIPVKGQYFSTQYLMDRVPQSNQLNPALQPGCKIFIGFPGLASVGTAVDNNFLTYNTLVNGDELAVDEVYARMGRMNFLNISADISPISIGYRYKQNYFTFSIADRFQTAVSYPKRLAGVLLYGNEQFIGQRARIRNTRVNSSYYREYSVGISTKWDEFTTLGMRGKLLFGKVNFATSGSRLELETDRESYALHLSGNLGLNSSFPFTLNQDANGLISGAELQEINILSMLMNPRNPGLAFDLGLVHEYSDEITLYGSVLDLGMILWTHQLNQVSASADYIYDGVQSNDFTDGAYVIDLYDSIYTNTSFILGQNVYLTPLPATVIMGASYTYLEFLDLGLVLRTGIRNRSLHGALTASANTTLTDWLQATVSWSYMNRSFLNAGAGLAYTGRGFQLFAVTDNVLGFLRPYDTRSVNFRFGMNLMLGCPGTKYYKEREVGRAMVPCPPGQKKRASLFGKKR